jgi:hypothetical protein
MKGNGEISLVLTLLRHIAPKVIRTTIRQENKEISSRAFSEMTILWQLVPRMYHSGSYLIPSWLYYVHINTMLAPHSYFVDARNIPSFLLISIYFAYAIFIHIYAHTLFMPYSPLFRPSIFNQSLCILCSYPVYMYSYLLYTCSYRVHTLFILLVNCSFLVHTLCLLGPCPVFIPSLFPSFRLCSFAV